MGTTDNFDSPSSGALQATDTLPVKSTATSRAATATMAQVGAFVGSAVGGIVFGGGTAAMGAEGNINLQTSSAGVNPGATAADNVIAVYSLPASSFSAAGKTVTVTACGSFAATGNNKRVKLFFNPSAAVVGSTITGGTLLADTGTVATNNGGWLVAGTVVKYGAAASNTQLCVSGGAAAGAVHAGVSLPALATATESGAILIAVTGNATTAATDIVFNFLEVNAMN